MEKVKTERYTDYLICNQGLATATGLSAMLEYFTPAVGRI